MAIEIQDKATYHPPTTRSFFNNQTKFSILAGALVTGYSARKAPKLVTVVITITSIAIFIIEKVIPRILLPTSYIHAPSVTYQTNASLTLSDGTVIRGYHEVRSHQNIHQRQIVVHFHGNGFFACTDHQAALRTSSAFEDFDIIAFNYRGTANSEGDTPPTHAQLVKDGEEIVQALIKKGYTKENITLFGHSLGGSIAPMVAKNLAERDTAPGRVVISNTFYSLRGIISTKPIMKGITALVLKIIGWDYNLTVEDWNAIEGNDNQAIGGGEGDTLIHTGISAASMLQQHIDTGTLVKGQITVGSHDHNDIKMSLKYVTDDIPDID